MYPPKALTNRLEFAHGPTCDKSGFALGQGFRHLSLTTPEKAEMPSGVPDCIPSLTFRPVPPRIGPLFFGHGSGLGQRLAYVRHDSAFHFASAAEWVESRAITTLNRGRKPCSKPNSFSRRFSQPACRAALPAQTPNALSSVLVSVQRRRPSLTTTWQPARSSAQLAARSATTLAFAVDLNRASGRTVSHRKSHQKPSGAQPRVVFSRLRPGPGATEGGEPCSRKS